MYGYDAEQLVEFFKLKGKNGRPPEVKGEELVSCCPFPHYKPERGKYFERNPSFAINLRSGKFNCFSCGKKGLTIEDLAWALGLPTPLVQKSFYLGEEKKPEKPEVPQNYKEYIGYFKENAIEYFESRGISRHTVEKFGIGSNRYKTKVFIPLCDKFGKLEGWQERSLEGGNGRWQTQPFGFVRSDYIFGLQFAREKGTILVESTTDALRLDSMGYSAVATLGASVSNRQLEIIADNFVDITLIAQNDPPGKKWLYEIKKKLSGKMELYHWNLPSTWEDVGKAPDYALKNILQRRKYLR